MGDTARQIKDCKVMDEEEYKKSNIKQSHISHEGHGGKKLDRDLQYKKAIPVRYSSSPRNGSQQSTLKNFCHSPSGRTGSNQKEGFKRWTADDQRSNSENWRERKSQQFSRLRNDSFHETDDVSRWHEGGERSNHNGRRMIQKGHASEGFPIIHSGGSESLVKQRKERSRCQSERDEEDYVESPVIDETMLSKRELLGLQQAEERLKRDCIFRLKRRPRKYPTAVYSCKLCDSLIDSVPAAHKHIKDRRHKRNLKEKKEEELLNTLPPPTPLQIQAVSCAIDKIVQEHGLDEEDLEKRLATVKAMENLIQNKLPGCSLRLYGSSCSRFGFKNSDLNIDIQFPSSMSQPDVLLLIQESLNQSDQFTDFDADFHARVPVVVCREKKSGLLCKVSAGNENACLTANLLAALGKLEPRLLSLVVAFRHWAKLCCIDRSEEGGLPPYVFSLMVVFFLQQRKEPVLPVYLGTWIKGFSFSKLGQYNLLAVEKDHVLWEQSTTTDGANSNSEETIARGKAPLVFAADRQCSVSVGQLWVDMLRFYALEFNMADLVISIRVKEKTSRDSKDWPKKRIAIEDPFSVKRNVARSLNSQLVYEYILHCLKATYKYFAMPQKKSTIKKPTGSGTVAVSQDIPSQNASNNKTPDTNKMSAINRQLEDLKIDSNINTVDLSQDGQKSHHSPCCKELDIVCSTKKKLVYDTPHPDIVPEDPDCITEEIILCDLEVQSCEELESCNDESEDDVHNLHGRKMPEDYIVIGQGMEEDSESGEALVAGNEENDSLSDLEGFGNPVIIETDSFGLKCSNIVMNKVAMDEESTEGTDELEEPPNEFVSQNFEHTAINNTDDDEEEAVSILLYHRDHLDSLTADDELEHTYIGSMDEGLSEDEDDDDEQPEQVSVDSIKDLEQDKDMSLPVTEHVQNEDSKEDSVLVGNVSEENILLYEFNKPVFTRGKLPMVVCNLCKREGHLKKDCPEDFKKIELDPLPPLTPKFRTILDQVCIQCYEDFSPTVLEDKARESIRQDLEDFIKREFQGARLSLFGSSKNGFGFKQSDLDICMTIDGLETAEELDCIRTIEDLARLLRKHEGLRNILPITTAKVPIVKFYHVRSGLEGDISLYNTLALHNTQLLAAYAAIDPRVKYLCYIMKVFTKICDIGDASRGSLSSYAYTLMVLYFLQQRNPPVIPVLQEIFKDKKKPETLVDGWNVYFFDKLDELANHWSEGYKNKESVGELWLGLLRFYTEDFDFKEHVICIRRKNLLTTFKKQWTSKYIVIEDPFDLNHNLGGGLSRKMTNFIMKAFINGRRVFGTPVKVFPKDYPTKMEYFFDPEVLTEGELAPNDRCCRICGKIGHFMKECPMRRKVRRRNNENAVNQRYPEKRLQRKTEDKEALSKSVENESSGTEGKHTQNTPKKPKQGTKSTNEACRDKTPRPSNEKWRKQEDRDLREKRCFICNREGHLKKECPQYKGSAGSPKSDVLCGSPSAPSPLKRQTRFIQITPQDEKKKQKVFLSPQSGSLSSKYMSQGKPSQKRTQQEY